MSCKADKFAFSRVVIFFLFFFVVGVTRSIKYYVDRNFVTVCPFFPFFLSLFFHIVELRYRTNYTVETNIKWEVESTDDGHQEA